MCFGSSYAHHTYTTVKVSHKDDELSVTNGIQASEEGAEKSRVPIGVIHRNLSGDSELTSIGALVGDI